MAGVRHVKEMSARFDTQGGMDRHASARRQSDGDDSRQHSPDKEVGFIIVLHAEILV